MEDKFYLDEDCIVSAFFGELGWFLQHFQSHFRYLAKDKYPDKKMIIFTDIQNSVFLNDFVHATIELPEWFYNLNLDRDCYESVLVDSPAGSLTPPKVYSELIKYMRTFYNKDKALEILPPRGCNYSWEKQPQIFCKFETPKMELERPTIVVFPRARVRAANRNIPEFIWLDLVNKLKQDVDVVLAGTPSGACLADYESDGVINLIKYNEEDKTSKIIEYLNNCVCSISSQSGGTHISLLSDCSSYIIGHEKDRHCVQENRLKVPTSFRSLQDYRAIDADTIINDVNEFIKRLSEAGYFNTEVIDESLVLNRPSLDTLKGKKNLIGAEIGVDNGLNALNMLENLDIKKLYLIDPYSFYSEQRNIGQNVTEEQNVECKKNAHDLLDEKYSDKIVWIEKQSRDAQHDIQERLDFVYVDGNHMPDYVTKDLELYTDIVKKEGLVAGHDFDYPPLIKAVENYATNHNLFINSGLCKDISKDWWFIKGNLVESIINNDINLLNEIIKERNE